MSKVDVGSQLPKALCRTEDGFHYVVPVFNLQPEGAYPGQLGITVANIPLIVITAGIKSASDYGATATAVAAEAGVSRVRVTLWGVPADPSHDALRGKASPLTPRRRVSFDRLKKGNSCVPKTRTPGEFPGPLIRASDARS